MKVLRPPDNLIPFFFFIESITVTKHSSPRWLSSTIFRKNSNPFNYNLVGPCSAFILNFWLSYLIHRFVFSKNICLTEVNRCISKPANNMAKRLTLLIAKWTTILFWTISLFHSKWFYRAILHRPDEITSKICLLLLVDWLINVGIGSVIYLPQFIFSLSGYKMESLAFW